FMEILFVFFTVYLTGGTSGSGAFLLSAARKSGLKSVSHRTLLPANADEGAGWLLTSLRGLFGTLDRKPDFHVSAAKPLALLDGV
ncbi:MAG: hypothetical protein LUD83_02755, partial [Clostridiales bacterium]|nr:hypothetical protein [Clostridiales bacterium]